MRTDQGAARTHLRHYYLRRLFQGSLWGKLARGEFGFRNATKSFARSIAHGLGYGAPPGGGGDPSISSASLPDRMAEGFQRFKGHVLMILSGNDLTAQEFKDLVASSRRWQGLLADPRVTTLDLSGANHTFARRDWRDRVAHRTETWVKSF